MMVFVALATALAFGLVFMKLRVPGGMMVGAICGIVFLSLWHYSVEMPYAAKFIAQVTAGTFIGCSVSLNDLKKLKESWQEALIVLAAFLILNLTAGIFITAISHMDILTALLCAVPGGMTDIPLTAADMGADVAAVVILQFIRLCVGIGIFPSWIMWMDRRKKRKEAGECEKLQETFGVRLDEEMSQKAYDLPGILKVLGIAAAAGWMGRLSGIPAGVLVMALLGVCIFSLLFMPVRLPLWLKRMAQLLSGAYIGCSISYESLVRVPSMLVPAMIITAAYMAAAGVVGWILRNYYRVPYRESMLMMSPAGASDMALIAADMGVKSPLLVVVQIVRMVAAASLFPQICYLVSQVLGRYFLS